MLYLLAADVFINQRISLNAGHLKQLFISVFLSHCHCVDVQIVKPPHRLPYRFAGLTCAGVAARKKRFRPRAQEYRGEADPRSYDL